MWYICAKIISVPLRKPYLSLGGQQFKLHVERRPEDDLQVLINQEETQQSWDGCVFDHLDRMYFTDEVGDEIEIEAGEDSKRKYLRQIFLEMIDNQEKKLKYQCVPPECLDNLGTYSDQNAKTLFVNFRSFKYNIKLLSTDILQVLADENEPHAKPVPFAGCVLVLKGWMQVKNNTWYGIFIFHERDRIKFHREPAEEYVVKVATSEDKHTADNVLEALTELHQQFHAAEQQASITESDHDKTVRLQFEQELKLLHSRLPDMFL